jgi:50S ribosomal protein L16 3-hydroxylase
MQRNRPETSDETRTMSSKPLSILGGRSAESFLSGYWQKQPLLVRNAFPNVESLVEAEELAGLSLEDNVESRIIIERSPVDWELRHGPFTEKTFNNLPQSHWTLLIQALDHQVPAVAELLEAFQFIPNWRIDDIMASFAPVGGSVGPHYDYYDVFLIQAHGQRRWQLGQQCDEDSELLPNLPVRILKNFQPSQEWVLNPGDMLYLPPGIAHYGVAENDCMTLSVGFRAPSEHEIINDFVHHLLEQPQQDCRYQDPDLQVQSNPGWISPEAVDRMADILQKMVSNREQIKLWMAEYLSQTKYDQNPEPPEEDYPEAEVKELLHENLSLRKEESSRLIYIGDQHRPEQLYINGTRIDIPPLTHSMILYLCKHRHYNPATLAIFCETPENLRLLTQLLNMGVVYFEEDHYREHEI